MDITRISLKNEQFQIRVGCWNIANAKRDETMSNSLIDRLPKIIGNIKKENPDVLILLEAGCPSKGVSWNKMALMIEESTHLRYEGTKKLNPTEDSFGKAVFYNLKVVAIKDFYQYWTTNTPNM
jgi:hypothetical protein